MSPCAASRGRQAGGRASAAAALALGLALAAVLPAAAEPFSFTADRVESVLAAGKERTVLSGRARVKSGSLLISADRIELSGKDYGLLECSGSVEAFDSERGIRIQSPRLSYERKTKLSRMEGPSVLEDRKNRVVLKADWIENDGKKETTLAQVNVRILKEGLSCRAEYAFYRRAEKLLELSGAPVAYKDGDEYRASRIVVDTETEEIRLEGRVEGKIVSSQDETAAPPAAPPAGAAAPGTAAGASADGSAPPEGSAP